MKKLVYSPQAIVEVTKELTFDSCHQLLNYEGACARLHGHTYKLQVTVEGVPDFTGMVIDFKDLKKALEVQVTNKLDHYNLNDKLEFNTTAENMVVWLYDVLTEYFNDYSYMMSRYVRLCEVKLWETPTSFATYRGQKFKPELPRRKDVE